jgi:hypothetical protein
MSAGADHTEEDALRTTDKPIAVEEGCAECGAGSGTHSTPPVGVSAGAGDFLSAVTGSVRAPQSVTLTLTSDPVALSLYYEWSLEEVETVVRTVFCLQPTTQVRVDGCPCASPQESLPTTRPVVAV